MKKINENNGQNKKVQKPKGLDDYSKEAMSAIATLQKLNNTFNYKKFKLNAELVYLLLTKFCLKNLYDKTTT